MKIPWQIKGRFCEETTFKLGPEVQVGTPRGETEKGPVQKNENLKEDTTFERLVNRQNKHNLKRQRPEMKLEHSGAAL